MSLGDITIAIFRCYDLECLRQIEDYALEFRADYKDVELRCIFIMLEVRNDILYQENIVREIVYKY